MATEGSAFGAIRPPRPKGTLASPLGLRPQARFGAVKIASPEGKLSSGARLMRNTGGDLTVC